MFDALPVELLFIGLSGALVALAFIAIWVVATWAERPFGDGEGDHG